MTAFNWNGPNPGLPPAQGGPWGGDLNWNESRNWNNQAAGAAFPQNGDDAGFGFSPPGVITGTIAFTNCSAGNFSGTSVQVQLSGVNCIFGSLDATAGGEIDVVSGSGTLQGLMQGGNCGSSGTLNGGTFDIIRSPSPGGSLLFQNLIDFPLTHRAAETIAAIMGSISGFSPLSVGTKGPFSYSTVNAQLDVFGGGSFTGGVSAIYGFGVILTPPYAPAKLNLKSMSAAGAAGEPINLFGGQVTFTVPAWTGHPLILDPANAQAASLDALIAEQSESGIPLVYFLPDARTVGIKNSGADWRVYCTVDVHQFSGGFGNVNGFAGINDDVLITTGAALTILQVKGKHFYGNLSFQAGGKVNF